MVNTRRSVGGKKLVDDIDSKPSGPIPMPPPIGLSNGSVAQPARGVKVEESSFDPQRTPVSFVDEDSARLKARANEVGSTIVHESRAVIRQARTQARRVPKKTWRSFFGTLGLLYLAGVYALVCRNDPGSENGICQAFHAASETRQSIVDFAHRQAQPYYKHAQPYLDEVKARVEPVASRVRPHYHRASSLSQPYFEQGRTLYNTHVFPQFGHGQRRAGVLAAPYLDQARAYYTKNVDPQWRHYQRVAHKVYANNFEPHVDYARKVSQPHLDHAQNVVAPAATRYYNNVAAPYAAKTYTTSRDTYIRQVHPRIVDGYTRLIAFLRSHVFPVFGRWHAVYIRPQVDRVLQKIWEAKTKKASLEAIVEAEANERQHAHDDGTDDLDAFIEELREEITEPEDDGAPIGEGSEAIVHEKVREAKLADATRSARALLEAERDRYEAEIENLAKTERVLLIERLNSIRSAAAHDIPARFDPRIKDLRSDAAKLAAKLEKYFDRVAEDERLDVEEKVAEADLISSKAVIRLSSRAESIHDELDNYGRAHFDKEQSAVQKAFGAVQSLVGVAQEKLGHGWTWLDDVTVEDWSRFHQLQKREDAVHSDFRALASGTLVDPRLSTERTTATLMQYKDVTDEVVDGFETSLAKVNKLGARRLRGTVADSIRGAYGQAKSALGVDVPEPTPTDVQGSASSILAVATDSAASAYSVVADSVAGVIPEVPDLHEATRALSLAVGATPTPESAQKSLSSVYAKASRAVVGEPVPEGVAASISSAASVASASAVSAYSVVGDTMSSALPDVDDLSASVHQATRAMSRAVGATPTPEALSEHAESAYARASRAVVGETVAPGVADSLSSVASVASRSAESIASQLSASAASVASVVSSSLPDADDLASTLHDATRAAARALGATPSPEGVAERAQSAYARASSAVVGEPSASGVSASVASAASVVSASASSLLDTAASAVPSLEDLTSQGASVVSAASSQASSVASQASKSATSILSAVSSSLPDTDDIASSLSSVSQAAASAVGATPAASGATASFASAYSRASNSIVGEPVASGVSASVSSALSAASEAVHQGTRVVVRAVGGEPSPEGLKEHVESATRAVSRKLAPSQTGALDEAVRSARDAADRVARRLEL